MLLKYYQQNVRVFIQGMDDDYSTVTGAYRKLLEAGVIESDIDMEKAKNECVSFLLPYIHSPEIDKLCDYCLTIFWEEWQKGTTSVDVDIETIKKYIGNLLL